MLENIENTAVCPSFLRYVSVFFGNPKKLGHLLLSNVRPNKGRCILYSNYIISMATDVDGPLTRCPNREIGPAGALLIG